MQHLGYAFRHLRRPIPHSLELAAAVRAGAAQVYNERRDRGIGQAGWHRGLSLARQILRGWRDDLNARPVAAASAQEQR